MYDFGENIFMNNEKYLDELDGRLQVLNELRKRIIELSKAIIGDTLYKEDFFFTSAMDRSVVLLDGISEMIKNRNLACGGILYVRRQIIVCGFSRPLLQKVRQILLTDSLLERKLVI